MRFGGVLPTMRPRRVVGVSHMLASAVQSLRKSTHGTTCRGDTARRRSEPCRYVCMVIFPGVLPGYFQHCSAAPAFFQRVPLQVWHRARATHHTQVAARVAPILFFSGQINKRAMQRSAGNKLEGDRQAPRQASAARQQEAPSSKRVNASLDGRSSTGGSSGSRHECLGLGCHVSNGLLAWSGCTRKWESVCTLQLSSGPPRMRKMHMGCHRRRACS